MQIESSNHPNVKNFSQSLKTEKEKVNCKDGFCSLPSDNQNLSINKRNMNLFDPI